MSALVLGVDPLQLQLPDGHDQLQPARARAVSQRHRGGGPDRYALGPERRGGQQLRLGYFTERRQLAGELSGDVGRRTRG